MNPYFAAAKAVFHTLKPLLIPVAKKACVGGLGAIASKFAYEAVGNFILSQRDKDIRLALEQDMELRKVIAHQRTTMDDISAETSARLIAEENGYMTATNERKNK